MVKKRRTPAQIRATKKLVALNKARRSKKRVAKRKVGKKRVVKRKVAKKRVVKRRVAKKRAVRRKVNPSGSYVYLIMAKNIGSGKEGFYTGKSFDTDIRKALMSKTRSVMAKVAMDIKINRRQWDVYVVKENTRKLKK
ncbi:MAG: hypothetical protein ABW166_04940 [Sedimenticola sp.]